jgi:hypothetical protein
MREQNLILMAYMKENMLACEAIEESCMQMQPSADHKKCGPKKRPQNQHDANTAKSKQPK